VTKLINTQQSQIELTPLKLLLKAATEEACIYCVYIYHSIIKTAEK